MRPTFDQTVSKLVNWYLKDQLKHDQCAACVVGNLCGRRDTWTYLFMTMRNGYQTRREIRYVDLYLNHVTRKSDLLDKAYEVCRSTGYKVYELCRIEHAFEVADRGQSNDDWMFNGLMDVVSVLADIHGISLEATQEAKKLFVKV